MATIQEQITALEEVLAIGADSVSMGDQSIHYRSHDEIQKILSNLKRQLAVQSGSASRSPFKVVQTNYSGSW